MVENILKIRIFATDHSRSGERRNAQRKMRLMINDVLTIIFLRHVHVFFVGHKINTMRRVRSLTEGLIKELTPDIWLTI